MKVFLYIKNPLYFFCSCGISIMVAKLGKVNGIFYIDRLSKLYKLTVTVVMEDVETLIKGLKFQSGFEKYIYITFYIKTLLNTR